MPSAVKQSRRCHAAPEILAAQSTCMVLSRVHCRVRFIDAHLRVALSPPVSDISFCTLPEASASPARRIHPRRGSSTSLRRWRRTAVALQVLFTPVGPCGVCNKSAWLSQVFASCASLSTVPTTRAGVCDTKHAAYASSSRCRGFLSLA